MAHNPSDAMVRLMRVAVSGVATLLGIAVSGIGAAISVADLKNIYGTGILVAGLAITIACGLRTAFLVVDWRKNRNENSSRP